MSRRQFSNSITSCTVAVVGGAGFLGSHLTKHLIEDRACDVIVLDNLCAGRMEYVHPKARFVHHDIIGSEERMWRLFDKERVAFVFNYAAWPYVPDSYARPLHVANVNFMGAIKVINAATEAGCLAILQVSSAELYGEEYIDTVPTEGSHSIKLDEDTYVKPHSTYGVAKAAVDSYVQTRWKEAEVPCIALRQFNCVGERETHPYIVPEIIAQIHKQMVAGEEEIIVRLGNNSSRDFLYAGDAVRAAVELLEGGWFGEVYNLGSESSIAVYDLAGVIASIMGVADRTRVVPDDTRRRPWEIWHLQSDNTKINDVIQHRPLIPLRVALDRTIRWYLDNGCKWGWER